MFQRFEDCTIAIGQQITIIPHQYPKRDIYMLATQRFSGAIFNYKKKTDGIL
ncbi:hypothetical protein [Pedobacter psychrodurus]|uniref:hypothetical protein n=1 Tax=Pedobacter psychrodurus TaxID=2530456 RepID=UPI0019809B06|nr:hypothetical protein [Pedobacter psychrodurus]